MFPCLRFFFNKVWVRIRSAWINCWMALRSSWQEPPGIERLAARWVVKLNVAWSVWLFLWGLKRMVRFCELEKRFVAEESWSLLLNDFSSTLVLAYKMIMHISQVQQHLKGGLVYISLCLTKGVDQLSTFCRFFFGIPSCHQVMFGSFEPAVAAPPSQSDFDHVVQHIDPALQQLRRFLVGLVHGFC